MLEQCSLNSGNDRECNANLAIATMMVPVAVHINK